MVYQERVYQIDRLFRVLADQRVPYRRKQIQRVVVVAFQFIHFFVQFRKIIRKTFDKPFRFVSRRLRNLRVRLRVPDLSGPFLFAPGIAALNRDRISRKRADHFYLIRHVHSPV